MRESRYDFPSRVPHAVSRNRPARISSSATAACGSSASPSSSSARVTTMHVVSRLRGDRRHPPGARVQHLDLADQGTRPERQRPARPLDEHRPRDEEHQRVGDLTLLHQDVARHEALLVAPREQLVEQAAGQPREQLRLADHPLVAAAVEEQRLSLAVARVLDVPEEERVVATPVRPHDAGDEVRQGALDERRLAHHEELRLDPLPARAGRRSRTAPSGPGRAR